ncbi:hypothetical protein [Nitratifractor salsuginis]|uniref:Uncharacterized protein n=1 Tax=Nitratifractor salsuginis (strain DSM 16511 / JCM 12458 / E9I37-1) TaxID=749222 RepID=E6WYD2_NITSE|nr:hypothetical protein [Nitratifractor salsuginis]ADV46444.1 hypothetical protein Nitsa_1191 [Nitratifractor salsuginis DSM 16511]
METIKEYESFSTDAQEIANELVIEEVASTPILVLVDERDWHLLENSEKVEAVEVRGGPKMTVGELKKKKVVFCTIKKQDAPLIDLVAEDWENIIEGGVVRLKIVPALGLI